MSDSKKPRLIGINHVAIEVGDIDEALAWYGQIFDFTLRNRHQRHVDRIVGAGHHAAEAFREGRYRFGHTRLASGRFISRFWGFMRK